MCGAPTHVRYAIDDHTVRRCDRCGLAFVAPTPSAAELERHYNESYAVEFEGYVGRLDESRLDELERFLPGRGRLLEVGASYGHWLAAARGRGWDVAGIELDARAAAHAREANGVPVRTGDLLSGGAPDGGPFDAVVAWHVLEHTREPRAELGRVFELLRPGGVLGLRVPNGASFGARVAGVWWPWAAAPDHLWYFTPASLREFATRCGFEVLEVRTGRGDGYDPFLNLALGVAGRLIDLRRRLSRDAADEPAGRGTGGGAAGAIFGRVRRITERLAALTRVERLLDRRGLGDELVLYARRPPGP